VAHPMEIMNGHINLAPRDPSRAVDKWHHDTTHDALRAHVFFLSSDSRAATRATLKCYAGPAGEGWI
jgi:hypothetical protein